MSSTMAWRTAGMLGWGGGPLILFFPPRLCETAMLEECVSDHCHERMSMEALPGSSLEVIKPEFVFQLLMSLFANPSGFDCGSQRTQIRLGRQIGKIIFFLSGRPVFTDEPGLVSRKMLLALSLIHISEPTRRTP